MATVAMAPPLQCACTARWRGALTAPATLCQHIVLRRVKGPLTLRLRLPLTRYAPGVECESEEYVTKTS
jgi:hypothetical protein